MKKKLIIIGGIAVVCSGLYATWWGYVVYTYNQHLPTVEITVNGVEREYYVYVPTNLPAGPLSLVVVLQGGDAGSWRFPQQVRFEELAEKEGFIYAQPVGKLLPPNEGAWQLNTTSESMQDIDFVEALIDDLSAKHTVDPARILPVGYSLGPITS